MVNPTEDGAEEASIVSKARIPESNPLKCVWQKNVPSLRLLFEPKSSIKSRPSTTPGQFPSERPARIDDAQRDTQKGTTLTPQDLRAAGASPPHSGQDSFRTLRRPVSPALLSIPGSPPLVTVNSPTSTPEESQTLSMLSPFPATTAKPSKDVNRGTTQSPWLPPVPPKRLRPHTMATSSHSSKAGIENDNTDLQPARNQIGDKATENITRDLPPPVNRADKPKVPTKPLVLAGRVNLEPLIPEADERMSPFSTPSSSEESIELISDRFGECRLPQTNAKEAPRTRVTSQLMAKPLDRTQNADDQISTLKLQGSDTRRLGFIHGAIAENPPELPPRRMQEGQVFDTPKTKSSYPATQLENSVSPRVFLPPPKRVLTSKPSPILHAKKSHSPRTVGDDKEEILSPSLLERQGPEAASYVSAASDYPEIKNSNRRQPYLKSSIREIDTTFDTRLIDTCGHYVCTTGHLTRVWDSTTGRLIFGLDYGEKETRVTALAFKPGVNVHEEGLRLWLGTNNGDIQEVDIATQSIADTKSGVHERREIIKIYRHQSSMWTLDDGGKLCVWLGDDKGLPDLQRNPFTHKVHKGHTFSIVIQDTLWMATGKDIWIFRPNVGGNATFALNRDPLNQPGVGVVTSGAVIGGQLDRVYFGHADGKVTIYSIAEFSCLGIVSVSVYKINSLAGAGFYLWAGYNTGMLYVYDTRTQPWTTRKDWSAHLGPIVHISVDRNSLWKDGVLRVVSLGADNALRLWDGTLEDDWLDDDMQKHDVEYCSFREITALVVTWNAGASTPAHFRYEENEPQFFQEVLQAGDPPDLLVFGFQELVDLEDKKLTAKTLFKSNRKKDPSEQEHMSRQYRAWRDYLIRSVEDSMPSNEPYHLLHTASLVGLFSCIFIKASQRQRIRNVNAAEIKRGMGGLHGNKGALILRFVLDDSSLCLVNCHLAAGQTQTVHRNNDLTAILESTILPPLHTSVHRETLAGGGDGSMILDNEICILNGDLNYRIDTMGRDTVVKAVSAQNFAKLLERDQLLVSRRRNPSFRVRAFEEFPIAFAPTYKYDIGSDRYDTSEKHRAPAWCDRILYRGVGKIRQLDYQRHELRVSDHRPVSGQFKIRIKTISMEKRTEVWNKSGSRFGKAKENLVKEAKLGYLRDILGVPLVEAMRLV